MTVYELSVIIPAWNEEKRLPATLEKVIDFLKGQVYTSEILVVTDGSKDRTVEVAESFTSIFPSLQVISFPFNKGKGFGVKEGMRAASGKYRLFMDSDYAVPIDFVTPFLTAVQHEGYDIVIGSRAMEQSKVTASQGFPRQQLAQLFGFLQWLVLRLPFRDTQCGFKLFTATAAESYFPQVVYDCAYFDAELLYLAHKSGAKIKQVPVTWQHDGETRLPIGLRRSIDLFGKLLRIRQLHPAHSLLGQPVESRMSKAD